MADDNTLELARQARARYEAAAIEVVRRYERALVREIRMRLRNPRPLQALESDDIRQSALAKFILLAACGKS
jgi:hypothetical protein